jgi:hypothetical protein
MKSFVRKQWPILTVYVAMLTSLAVIVFMDFRAGAILLSLSILLGFGLRFRLSDSSVGLLRNRRRRIDLTVLASLGTVLLILSLVVPHGR